MNGEPPDVVPLRLVLLRPLPLTVREHPERSDRARVTLVREQITELTARHPPMLEALLRIQRAPLIAEAHGEYAAAGDKAATALGLGHRRELLALEDGPLPVRHDPGDVLALTQLAPVLAEQWALATDHLHIALARPAWAASVRHALSGFSTLAPLSPWLAPALLRWLHVRWYEVLFGPFRNAEGQLVERLPGELEEAALSSTPGRPRKALDRAPKQRSEWTLAKKAEAWFAVRVCGDKVLVVAARWHERLTQLTHSKGDPAHGIPAVHLDDCACRRIVRTGIAEVDRLLAYPS